MQAIEGTVGIERGYLLKDIFNQIVSLDLDSAFVLSREIIDLAEKYEDDSLMGFGQYALAESYFYSGNYDPAMVHQRISIKIRTALKDTVYLARSYNVMGVLYDVTDRIDSALAMYSKALELNEAVNDQFNRSTVLGNIAFIYQGQGNIEMSLRYYRQVLKIDERLNRPLQTSITISNIGFLHSKNGDLDSALYYHKRAQKLREELKNDLYIARSLNNIGLVYFNMGELDKAEQYMKRSLSLKREYGNSREIAQTLKNLGTIYLSQEDYVSATRILEEGQAILDSIQRTDISTNNLKFLAQAYAGTGEYRKAYETEVKHQQLLDSLNVAERANRMNEYLAEINNIKQERELDSLLYRDQLQNQRLASASRRNQMSIIFIGILGLLVIGIFVLFLQKRSANRHQQVLNEKLSKRNEQIKEKRDEIKEKSAQLSKKNAEILRINENLERIVQERTQNLVQTNKELDTFLHQTSHALRAPLMRIIGLLDISEKSEDEATRANMQKLIGETINAMDQMLHKLLNIQELKLKGPQATTIDLQKMIEDIVEDVALRSDHAAPELSLKITTREIAVPDRRTVQMTLQNVLENAWHFRNENPAVPHRILVQTETTAQDLFIHIEDNGMGIPKGEQEAVFQMFHRATYHSKGSGLGLYVAKKALEQISGDITVTSEENQGCQFTIRIPRAYLPA